MKTLKPTIRETEVRTDGTVNVKIRVSHDHATRYIATDYYVLPENFDPDTGLILPGGEFDQDSANRANLRIQIDMGVLAEKIDKIRNQLKNMKIADLMAILRDKRSEYDLLSLIDERIERYKKIGNLNYKETFEGTKALIENNVGKLVPLESITPSWLEKLEYKLRFKKMKPNSIGVHMRNIRTVYNQAITMGLVDLSSYPFRKYRIPKEITRKRNLSAQEISTIAKKEIKQPLMAWARDMYMLSFYLIGINMKDLMFLEKIEDGRIHYIRSKGKKNYSIKVYPEAQAIFDRYPGKKYLLNTMDNYANYRTATKRINKKLKKIAELCKIDKEITTYYARHSWATIGRSLKISKDDISLGLGHQRSNLEMTEIYIDEEQEVIDIANRMIIDHIINTPPSE